LRADSGFARDELMAWCEANGVHFVFGLAQNDRLNAEITSELEAVKEKSERTGKPARRFKDKRILPTPPVAPSVSSCLRLALSYVQCPPDQSRDGVSLSCS
jgi:Transposase DDE domain group 1